MWFINGNSYPGTEGNGAEVKLADTLLVAPKCKPHQICVDCLSSNIKTQVRMMNKKKVATQKK